MFIGLVQLQVERPTELVVNNQGQYIIVANSYQMQILKSVVDFGDLQGESEPKIMLDSICSLNFDSLPL